jgi:hypothetical protein
MPQTILNSISFRLSPLIQITLISLYLALTIPLPFLAEFTHSSVSPMILWGGIGIGLVILIAFLSEKVVLDDAKIEVCYPRWIPSQFRRGWRLNWTEIQDLKLRTTGQGGLVYYFVTQNRDRAYLLPMRVAGFSRLVEMVQAKTGIDTTDIRPLAQPWMYLILFVFTLFLWLMDGWTIWTAMTQIV